VNRGSPLFLAKGVRLHSSLADLDNPPDLKDLAEDIVQNLDAGLVNFRSVLAAPGK